MSWHRLGFFLLISACGTEPPPINQPPKPEYAGVVVNDNAFEPNEVTIRVADHVTWVWEGDAQHGLRFYGSPSSAVQSQGRGGIYDRAFETPGIYLYYCPIHGGEQGLGVTGMSGRIVVH